MACNGCGSKDIVASVQAASEMLVKGHLGVAAIYRTMAMTADEDDATTFLYAASMHDNMAKMSAEVVVPNRGENNDVNERRVSSPATPAPPGPGEEPRVETGSSVG